VVTVYVAAFAAVKIITERIVRVDFLIIGIDFLVSQNFSFKFKSNKIIKLIARPCCHIPRCGIIPCGPQLIKRFQQ
jgi:hypothetical protein